MPIAMERRVLRTAMWALVALGGCNCEPSVPVGPPEDAARRFATVVCEGSARCGCVEQSFGSLEACIADRMSMFEDVQHWAGMVFDEDCFERVIAWLETAACDDDGAHLRCEPFRTTLSQGDSCSPRAQERPHTGALAFFNAPCSGSSFCHRGFCEFPPPRVDPGEPCVRRLGVLCTQGNYCTSAGVCEPQAAPGEACTTGVGCVEGGDYYCAGLADGAVGVCTRTVALGEACDPREFFPCSKEEAPRAYCGSGGVCEPSWPAVCELAALPPGFFLLRDRVPYE
jgi:hypothetical protein